MLSGETMSTNMAQSRMAETNATYPSVGDAPDEAHHEAMEAAAHLAEAARLIGGDDPALAAFFTAFTRYASPEDLIHYTGAELAGLAQCVFAHARERASGESLIAIIRPQTETPLFAREETLILAVNDDMPFLYDSCIAELRAQGIAVRAAFHHIVPVARNAQGERESGGVGAPESVILLALEGNPDDGALQALTEGLRETFAHIRSAVRDWRPMLARLKETLEGLMANPPPISPDELKENLAFLAWLSDNHFTFLGARDYVFDASGNGRLEGVWQSGLGVLADPETRVIRRGQDRAGLTPEVRDFLMQPSPLVIAKSNTRSRVHRRVHMDYIGVKTFDAAGNLTGERRFVGLFTSSAYHQLPADIPLLRRKVSHVLASAGLPASSHDGKALTHILDVFPRDELFQTSEDELLATALGILNLGERPKVRVFLRFDRFDRYVSALVFVPRERYNSTIREKIHARLAQALDGRVSAAYPMLDDEALARVLYIIGRNPGMRPEVDARILEADISAMLRSWEDNLSDALILTYGRVLGDEQTKRYGQAFSAGYRGLFNAEDAVSDIEKLDAVLNGHGAAGALTAHVYTRAGDEPGAVRLKLYVQGGYVALSDCLPVFENLGLKVIAEDSFEIAPRDANGAPQKAAIHDFLMTLMPGARHTGLEHLGPLLEDAFHAVWTGQAESDGFNRLVAIADMYWRDVVILRAVAKFLRQAGFSLSQPYVEAALAKNSDIATYLVALFRTLHDPDGFTDSNARKAATEALRAKIETALADVPSADDDRTLRALRAVIDAMLRTSFFQTNDDGVAKSFVAFKLSSRTLDMLPAPKPLFEIFVYSPEMEGVHLRFGKVARGGIRWSDRAEDFRTEILGLVKAQQVKNAVIVPVGAKGGFYPKRLPLNATRDEVQKVGIAAYQTLIGAMLDLTDNIGPDGTVIPPPRTLRYDGDDPYLVVAADKGTATFSDIANAIAEARGFWLGDAFASGGSQGYDHKKMGITARGAWEAVKRHFREAGRDIQHEPFTCIGVGDMSGDVFGNAMLLSDQTKLLAAFDHRHIFIDPDPDPAKSWAERKRLFDLPRSSWDDYDKSLLSPGGGVYPRSAKEIPLNDALKAITGLTAERARPADIIRALLGAPVDLLFFGGIGTYIKSAAQAQSDAGDRANDALRVNGRDVRALVVGEGANLGTTQLGRVEYALEGGPAKKGGRIDTDAIDNSAGVDTSDHEVNIKILMSGPLRRGEISADERNALLVAMTDDVGHLVLKDNYDQTQALSVAEMQAPRDIEAAIRFMRDLEKTGRLDRMVEQLPDDESLRTRLREGRGLTRPELAVVLAYAKLDLFEHVIESKLPDDPALQSELSAYFPKLGVEHFAGELATHRLHREIVATQTVNQLVNLAGPFFVQRMRELSSAPAWCVTRAFVIADRAFALSNLKARIDALDLKVPAALQNAMMGKIAELLRRLGLWFVVNLPADADIGAVIADYDIAKSGVKEHLARLLSPFERETTDAAIAALVKDGVPEDLARDIASLPALNAVPEIVALSHSAHTDIETAAKAYAFVGAELGLDRLLAYASKVTIADYWDRMALRRIIDDVYAVQRALAQQALGQSSPYSNATNAVASWVAARRDDIDRTRLFLDELEKNGPASIAKLSLANSHVQKMASVAKA